jgi:hypothetical protein
MIFEIYIRLQINQHSNHSPRGRNRRYQLVTQSTRRAPRTADAQLRKRKEGNRRSYTASITA